MTQPKPKVIQVLKPPIQIKRVHSMYSLINSTTLHKKIDQIFSMIESITIVFGGTAKKHIAKFSSLCLSKKEIRLTNTQVHLN